MAQRFQNLSCGRQPSVNATIEDMLFYRVQEVPRKDDANVRNTPCGGGDNGVVARNVRMHDIKVLEFQNLAKLESGNEICRIQKRKDNIGIQRTICPSGDGNAMPELPQFLCKFNDVGFAAA